MKWCDCFLASVFTRQCLYQKEPTMQPKRPRLVDHRLFPIMFWTLMFLIVLGGMLYLLAPALAQTYKNNPDTLYLPYHITHTVSGWL